MDKPHPPRPLVNYFIECWKCGHTWIKACRPDDHLKCPNCSALNIA